VACLELLSRNSRQGTDGGTCYLLLEGRSVISFLRTSSLPGRESASLRRAGKQSKWALSNAAETTALRIPFCGEDGLPRPVLSGTTWGRVLLEKITVAQLVVLFPAFKGARRFITVFTKARHRSLS
jgi:hypothetical protein